MKLTEPDTKITVKRSNVLSLNQYIYELLTNTEEYFNIITADKTYKKILIHNIKTFYEKLNKLIFKYAYVTNEYKSSIKFTDSEKLTFVKVFSIYPLPMDINFIEYELTKKLLK